MVPQKSALRLEEIPDGLLPLGFPTLFDLRCCQVDGREGELLDLSQGRDSHGWRHRNWTGGQGTKQSLVKISNFKTKTSVKRYFHGIEILD